MSESLWTTTDVSRYLSVSRSWVYREAKNGHLPCIKMAGIVRFHPEAIVAYARANARGGDHGAQA